MLYRFDISLNALGISTNAHTHRVTHIAGSVKQQDELNWKICFLIATANFYMHLETTWAFSDER